MAQLMHHFATQNPSTEFVAVSPVNGKIPNVQNMAVNLGGISRLRSRITSNRFVRAVGGSMLAESSIAYQRARKSMLLLTEKSDEQTIVICLTFTATLLARQILPKAKLIYWIHSLPRLGQEYMAFRAVNAADIVAVPSNAIYLELFKLICRNKFTAPVWVIPNCVDQEQFKKISPERCQNVRRRLGLSENDLAIIHVGRAPEKGLQIVELALLLCRFNQRNIVLVAVGGQTCGRRRLSKHAEILETGRVTPQELNEIYQACDLGVVPSVWWENCPLALLEMMSLGLCPLASRVGGIPEMIEDGRNGLLVDAPNDVAAWARAIDSALTDDDLRQRLGHEASKSTEARFGTKQYTDNWLRLLNTVVPQLN
ncbi:glycosyltransferase family 4 protein [Novipirellula sp.]|uniref:glycosyltransferase family 4 protein n=1 Tax=Novipirellula sp. TaxID=2795430 RepID=UPI0035633208